MDKANLAWLMEDRCLPQPKLGVLSGVHCSHGLCSLRMNMILHISALLIQTPLNQGAFSWDLSKATNLLEPLQTLFSLTQHSHSHPSCSSFFEAVSLSTCSWPLQQQSSILTCSHFPDWSPRYLALVSWYFQFLWFLWSEVWSEVTQPCSTLCDAMDWSGGCAGQEGLEELSHIEGQQQCGKEIPLFFGRRSGCALLEQPWRDTPCQGKRKPSKMVSVARGHQREDTLKPCSQKTSKSYHTRTTALSKSMKSSHACRATQDGRVMVERLEKGMVSHFSILAWRTPWTVLKGKMIGYQKRNTPGH